MTRIRLWRAAVAVLALLAACGGDGDGGGLPAASPPTSPSSTAGDSTSSSAATAATTAPGSTPPQLKAVRVASIAGALALAVRTGDDALYVAAKTGEIHAVRGGTVDQALVLDLSGEVSNGSEQGLLGLTFSPDGSHLYVNYTDRRGDTRVVEHAFAGGRADPGSRRELLFVEQPYANHNGGQVAFGPDGFLYVGLGDGGSGGDPEGNGQRLDTLLGKLLRIDPKPDGERPYSIPPGNPFAGRQGARPEIWAYGLRNPWRFTFDRDTDALWIGDVGQNAIEEVNAVEASAGGGQNYGWNHYEGTRRFEGAAIAGTVAPVHEYSNGNGNCSVSGGYVYRGTRIAGLQGTYVFADFCAGRVLGLISDGSGLRSVPLGPALDAVASFGEDGAGELYALSLSSGVYRLEQA